MNNPDFISPTLSIGVPGIRTGEWEALVGSIERTIKLHSFEIIFVGPYEPPVSLQRKSYVKYIQDFGCPSRALQISSVHATGTLFTWAVDDGVLNEGSLDDQLELFLKYEEDDKRILNLIYTEGEHYKWGADLRLIRPQDWYRPRFHDDFKPLTGVQDDWYTAILFVMRLSHFKHLGGIDCRFETINYNLHDLSFRAQRDGFSLYFSDIQRPVHRIDWQDGSQRPDGEPIFEATFDNDKPLLENLYGTQEVAAERPICIDYDNWKSIPEKWPRRWGKTDGS
tara:strand:+ start:11269 stop:12111 length:843 start_codon:yes stop_codon:yes gene_type:complete